jgi:hypothetical protein
LKKHLICGFQGKIFARLAKLHCSDLIQVIYKN